MALPRLARLHLLWGGRSPLDTDLFLPAAFRVASTVQCSLTHLASLSPFIVLQALARRTWRLMVSTRSSSTIIVLHNGAGSDVSRFHSLVLC